MKLVCEKEKILRGINSVINELNGEKIEYNGYVFYTEDRVTEAEEYSLTEERTGVCVGSFKRLKGRWEKFVEIVATYPDVLSYPIEEKGGE